jgi:hypothetical protein
MTLVFYKLVLQPALVQENFGQKWYKNGTKRGIMPKWYTLKSVSAYLTTIPALVGLTPLMSKL